MVSKHAIGTTRPPCDVSACGCLKDFFPDSYVTAAHLSMVQQGYGMEGQETVFLHLLTIESRHIPLLSALLVTSLRLQVGMELCTFTMLRYVFCALSY
jgi:hypothetical protein